MTLLSRFRVLNQIFLVKILKIQLHGVLRNNQPHMKGKFGCALTFWEFLLIHGMRTDAHKDTPTHTHDTHTDTHKDIHIDTYYTRRHTNTRTLSFSLSHTLTSSGGLDSWVWWAPTKWLRSLSLAHTHTHTHQYSLWRSRFMALNRSNIVISLSLTFHTHTHFHLYILWRPLCTGLTSSLSI